MYITNAALLGLLGIVAATFYLVFTRPAHRGAALAVFGAYLFGPEVALIALPSTPPLDKTSILGLALCLAILVRHFGQVAKSGIFSLVPDGLILVGMYGAVMTALTNPDPLVYGSWKVNVLPGMTLIDGLHTALYDLLRTGFVFLVGRWVFRTPGALRDMWRYILGFGLVMVPFILYEIRMSPTVHLKVYGFGPIGQFGQTIRWGGFRPNVFTTHGLSLAIFMMSSWFAALTLHRTEPGRFWRTTTKTLSWSLFVVLILCKSTGAILWAFIFGPIAWKLGPKMIQRIALAGSLLAFSYPMLRSANLVPVEETIAFAGLFGKERADSVKFRLVNEGVLLEKARKRLTYGWGTYGRNGIYHEELGDKEITIADGAWIIEVSVGGIVGFIQGFGMLVLPVLMVHRAFGRVKDEKKKLQLCLLSLLLSILTLELLPNGLYSNWNYLIAGALAGLAQSIRRNPRDWQPDGTAGAGGPPRWPPSMAPPPAWHPGAPRSPPAGGGGGGTARKRPRPPGHHSRPA